jgi:hypothetical protein
MRVLTVRQPWASLIIRGGKDIENRGWATGYRGPLAIHSSAKMNRSDMEDACAVMRSFIPRFSAHRFQREDFPAGVILGTVEVAACVVRSESPWFFGPFGFLLQSPIPFANPIPCKGRLGIWWPPEDITAQIVERRKAYWDQKAR